MDFSDTPNGRELRRKRDKVEARIKRLRIAAVEQASARRLFLFQACAKDPGEHVRLKAAADRLKQLGGEDLRCRRLMAAHVLAQALDDPSLSEAQVANVRQQMVTFLTDAMPVYAQRERAEREVLEMLGETILEAFREENPCAGQVSELDHLGEAAHRMRMLDLDRASRPVRRPQA